MTDFTIRVSHMYTETKKELRKKIKNEAARLSTEYCQTADAKIIENIINLKEFQSSDVIFCYVGRSNEINTIPLLMYILSSGKRLGIPKCISKGIMEVYEIKGLEDLCEGAYGIMEPAEWCSHVEPDEIQFVCVPCLSCSSDGKRLGYGGGFYDRYLEKIRCKKTVLCRSLLMNENIPVEVHDIEMDLIVTEKGVIDL